MFSLLILVVALLNYISPCDGRGGNIFTIGYSKLMGTYNATVLPLTDPFKYSITPFIQMDYLHVTISVRVSSVSKIACVIAASDSKPETLEYLESKDTRYYIRTNQESKLAFRVNYLSKENQRLFCNITGLLYSPAHVEFYKSDPFWVDYETVKLNQLQCDKTSFSFSYQPNQIKLQFSPQDYSERKYLVLCESAPLPGTIVDCQQPHLFCSIGTLPMKIHGERREHNYVHCGVYRNETVNWIQIHDDLIAS